MSQHIPGSKAQVSYLKGLAILAVIAIHFINTFMTRFQAHSQTWNNFLVADQITRFCVPLFVALSGFALAQKYALHPPGFFSFLFRRTVKLIPPYLFWSAVYLTLGYLVASRPIFSGGLPLWDIVFLGKAQYHLYFVPMLFQAYLVFPVLLLLSRRRPFLILATALAIQLLTYTYNIGPGWNDQKQYILFNSWIFYFVLGLTLNKLSFRTKYLGLIFAAIGLIWSVKDTFYLLTLGHDVIWSARFTRFPVMLYSTGVVILAPYLTGRGFNQSLRRFITDLGANSYQVYLGHVLLLQILARVV